MYEAVQRSCREVQWTPRAAPLQVERVSADTGVVYTAPVNPDPSIHPLRGRRYHFSGAGGSGMTPLAILAASLGASVSGSDRNLDRGLALPSFDALRAAGVTLVPQDGSGVIPELDALVHSTAVEAGNPDFQRAVALGVDRIRRGSFLAKVASSRRTVAIAGTSGKSTVTAMVAHILVEAGLDPWFLGGGPAVSLAGSIPPGSLRVGAGSLFVVETDESDGSVAEFEPAIAVLTNLSRDHKEIAETQLLFEALVAHTREQTVMNCGDPVLEGLRVPAGHARVTVAVEGGPCWAEPDFLARSIALGSSGVRFELRGVPVAIPFPGVLSVENGTMAIAAATAAGVALEDAARALESFGGVKRRLERIGSARGIDVYDDFGHNPVKIGAALQALRPTGAYWVYYQPHGYGPTRFFRDELVSMLQATLRPGDHFLLAPIYDAGGTANRTIRSEDLVEQLRGVGVDAELAATREDAARRVATGARPGDRAVVMGARDDTLPAFARALLQAIQSPAGQETAATRPHS
ncbi:MAG TPA: Mur ligase domain-containing protein [Candidatus Eisenbacteria bacterium]|nr:Mur ligase domain-containing protein [Candidatus Eisenbacteria bacterium]